MPYIRRNWVNGEIITDDKLNNIEEGITEALKRAEDVERELEESGDDSAEALEAIEAHTKDKNNPHGVTKKQIGLENVPNVTTNDQTPTFNEATTLATVESGEKMNIIMGKIKHAITNLINHLKSKDNPHAVTASQVGLGSVPNVSTNDQTPTYTDATTLATLQSGERLSVAFGKIKLALTHLINHLSSKSNPHAVTAAQVGLGNVPNKATNDQTPTYEAAGTLATVESGEKLSVSFGKIKLAITKLIDHLANKSNPHGVTLPQLSETDALKIMTAAEREKLAGVEAGATKYSHPATHPATMISGLADFIAGMGYGKFAHGSYSGSYSSCGSDTASTITLPFTPSFILIWYSVYSNSPILLANNHSIKISQTSSSVTLAYNWYTTLTGVGVGNTGTTGNVILLWNNELKVGNVKSSGWASTSVHGYNVAGQTYYWIAFP